MYSNVAGGQGEIVEYNFLFFLFIIQVRQNSLLILYTTANSLSLPPSWVFVIYVELVFLLTQENDFRRRIIDLKVFP